MKNLRIYLFLLFSGILFLYSCSEDEQPAIPVAGFSFEANETDPLTVSFTNSSENATTQSWDFGDSNTSTQVNPVHTFAVGGSYTVSLTVINESGEDTATETVVVEELEVPVIAGIVGQWKMAPEEAALAVGPSYGSADWWFNTTGDVTLRDCYFDDVYTFNADGTFTIEMDGTTWLEAWQGVENDQCGTPVDPHDGQGSYTYEVTESTLKLIGTGAFVGLPKAVNAGELPNVDVPSDVTYQIDEFVDGDTKTLKLIIETGTGVFWTFRMVSI